MDFSLEADNRIEELLNEGFEEFYHDERFSDGEPMYVDDGSVRYFRLHDTRITIDIKYGTYIVEKDNSSFLSTSVNEIYLQGVHDGWATFSLGTYTQIEYKL